jgi:cytochrome P450
MLVQTDMTDGQIRDELMTLLAAGHETTATGLAWAVERLARHPDAWERLRAEGDPYADMVVKETLRLRPVIPIVVRHLMEDFEVAGRTIPAGNQLVPCIWLVHRREDLYPDPHAFRPERWEGVKPGTYTWIPFGGGVRRCIGAAFAELEMRIVLQALAERSPRLVPDRPGHEPVLRRAITLTPARGARVHVGTGASREA